MVSVRGVSRSGTVRYSYFADIMTRCSHRHFELSSMAAKHVNVRQDDVSLLKLDRRF